MDHGLWTKKLRYEKIQRHRHAIIIGPGIAGGYRCLYQRCFFRRDTLPVPAWTYRC